MVISNYATPAALALLLGLGLLGCSKQGNEDAAPAPVDTAAAGGADTVTLPSRADSATVRPDTSMATPPITPPSSQSRDTPPAGAARPSQPSKPPAQGQRGELSQVEYEGWRQYSVNCARCHGQDVLPNPVAANLLISLGPGGPIDTPEKFMQVVSEGRPARGMPPFKGLLSAEQIQAIYAYVKGRAEGRIPPGRPERPEA